MRGCDSGGREGQDETDADDPQSQSLKGSRGFLPGGSAESLKTEMLKYSECSSFTAFDLLR